MTMRNFEKMIKSCENTKLARAINEDSGMTFNQEWQFRSDYDRATFFRYKAEMKKMMLLAHSDRCIAISENLGV